MIRIQGENRWLLLDALAIVTGLVGGMGAVVFRRLAEGVHRLFFGPVLNALPGGDGGMVLLPVLGGLVVGLLILRFAPEAKGETVPALMETLHKRGGRIRPRTAPAILLASAVTIGSGGSAGREGPIAQIGASFGSLLGQRLRLNVTEVQILAVSGFVAGLAGTFNAPLGSAIFGMEVVMRRFRMVDAVPILLSAVVGAATASAFLGQNPAFTPLWTEIPLPELFLCLFLGLIFGVLALLWGRLLAGAERLFEGIPLSEGLKPGLGGLVAGAAGLYFIGYGVMGVGYDGVDRVLAIASGPAGSEASRLALFLLALAAAKALATASTLGSGGCGGTIGPTLVVGAVAGASFGLLFGEILPAAEGHAPAYALLGAAALLAGSAGAPLASVVLISEMAADYSLLPALMIASAASYAVASIGLSGSTIFTMKLVRKGVSLEAGEALLERVLVRDAMVREVASVGPETTVRDAMARVFRENVRGFPVVEEGKLAGIVTFDDLRRVPEGRQGEVRVGEVAVKDVIVAFPDENMKNAMDRLYRNNVGRLVVVDREDPKKVVGIVTRTDAIAAYEVLSRDGARRD
ncbi:chloride channel protein [Methanotrichaceae archaeon M04Ac]|jgi:CIC family chloride channel protein|uniref:Chloride channel protein n=1 Tax=Candidatus Methanocrinis alkalitolerans TaxID=3033395 RepID=A0ABT5XFR4_9EURY|nr:chloride channel protein [Candidatus Methanocrinis alkalitolerans]MDF0593553.1 chloride channel protein [Candidatus Methanocrinis alkalitolerans]